MSIRALRKKARRQIHDAMSVPAVHHSADRSTSVECTVRIHDRTQSFGDMTGFDYQPAERITTVPEIVCLVEDVSPKRGDVFVTEDDETGAMVVYEVETPMPPDGQTITSQVSRMKDSKVAAEDPPFALPGCC